MRRTTFFVGLLLVGTVAVGCLDDSITGTRPVTILITAQPATAAVDQPVTVSYTATGTGLQSVIVEWGDAVIDTVTFSGLAVEAAGGVEHAYSDVGSYDITGTVSAGNGTASTGITVQIN